AYSATHRADLAEFGLRGALRDGRPAGVFEWAERGRTSRLAHRLVRPPADPELAELLPRLRTTTRELEQAGAQGKPLGRLRHRQVELERRIRHRSRLPHADVTGRPAEPVTPRELRAVLGERALVEFVRLDGAVLALTLVDGRLRLHPLGDEAVLAGLLDRVPFALRQLGRSDGLDRSRLRAEALLRTTTARLDTALLAPLGELGDRPLVVVPTGVLHSVPWSTLPSCVGRPVAVSPSATLWHAAATRSGERTGAVAVAGGPGLAGAREEALAVAAVHGAQALVDSAATVDAVLAALATADTVHLAAHGTLSADNPLFSAVRLDDGPLLAHDVQGLERVPDTVLLAACDVGRSVVVAGHELLGLSATFLERGTTALIAPVVPVPDAETTPLMIAVHRRLAAGAPPAAALAEAQREVAADGPASTAAAAAFVCVGTG
ncbi:MAG TPA: CHAT domain-containing protein, partial [Umezawaea sp.]|nr:CHAT domain-containing protein [Umezawaea sp.]